MKRIQKLLDVSSNALFAADASGRIVVFNKKTTQMFGKIKNIDEIECEELVEDIKKNKNASIRCKKVEYNVITEVFKGVTFVCLEDISEKSRLYKEKGVLLEQFNYTEKTTRLGYWEYNIKTGKAVWSEEMYNILGYKGEKYSKHRTIGERVVEEDKRLYDEVLKDLITKSKPLEVVLRVVGEKGAIRYCLVKGSIVHDEKQHKAVGTMQDLTDIYEKNIALNKAKQRAEELNLAKSYFLAQASHDLRQPMQAHKLYIYNLKEEKLNRKQQEIANKIEDSTYNLEGLLNSLLDISKIESGGFYVEKKVFELKTLLDDIVGEFVDLAEHSNIKIKTCIECDTKIKTDPVLLERIIRNIFSNAVKYTKDTILISCNRNNNKIDIIIQDNGYGISEVELPHIFEEFYQSEKIAENRRLGAGLGLSIVKRLTAILDGKIKVKSTVGKGSKFILELPL
ncbi:MAG: PAS domain-containing protein [Lactobacillus sp.]|jgi:signal transduction histidine kinase|nr:PAS domain-containing protein [Lactobacillus sp.]